MCGVFDGTIRSDLMESPVGVRLVCRVCRSPWSSGCEYEKEEASVVKIDDASKSATYRSRIPLMMDGGCESSGLPHPTGMRWLIYEHREGHVQGLHCWLARLARSAQSGSVPCRMHYRMA